MPMKPKTKVMAVSTMLGLTIGFAALFFYIEEKKYEALYYQTELNKLQQQSGFEQLMQQLVAIDDNGAIATLRHSSTIQALTTAQAKQLIADIAAQRENSILTNKELTAIKQLMALR